MIKKDSKNRTVATQERLIELDIKYRNAMAQEKLRRIKLQNEHQEFDLHKKTEEVCYRAIAVKEFENAIGDIYARIKNADEQLTAKLELTQKQQEILHAYMEDILMDLSNIDINLSSTDAVDHSETY